MKNKDKNGKLKITQLYPEQGFLDYCLYDQHRNRKINGTVSTELLRAFEKDGLILPLATDKGIERQQDGSPIEKDVNYYSPFQIFLISAMSTNSVNDEGLPMDFSHDIEWQKQHGSRFVSWGTHGFNAPNFKNPEYKRPDEFNPYDFSNDFHNLLRFIHSFDTTRDYSKPERNRYYTGVPSFQYDFEPDKKTIKAELKKYNLTVDKIKKIKVSVGSYAVRVDPLEEWYYYIEKHPQWRKDRLKGPAMLSQDLYGFCQIIDDIVFLASGEKPKPLIDVINASFPWGHTGVEYASGTDIAVIKDVYEKISKWVKSKKNKDVIDFIANTTHDNQTWDQIKKLFDNSKNEITDFEQRYGERRYLHGFMRTMEPETKIKFDDLDNKTKSYVEMIMRQRREHDVKKDKNGKTILSTDPDYDDVAELIKKGKTDEAIKKHFEHEQEYEVARAIESRLDDISREIMWFCGWINSALWQAYYKIENEKKLVEPRLWGEFREKNKEGNPDEQRKSHISFIHTGLKEALRPWDEKLKMIDMAQKELNGFSNEVRRIYCGHCRKNFVQLHHDNGDRLANPEQICDECLSNTSDYKTIKANEWKCERCGKLIYKFAHGNILSDVLFNTASATIRLEYGEASIEAICPNKTCKKKQHRSITWGWKS